MPTHDAPDEVTYDGSPTTVEQKRVLTRVLTGLVPEDVMVLTTSNEKTRTLTVERVLDDWRDTPEWTGLALGGGETGYILSGHGTEYLLVVQTESDQPLLPKLTFPSRSPFNDLVMRARVRDHGPQLTAEATADDLFWRVNRYDGR